MNFGSITAAGCSEPQTTGIAVLAVVDTIDDCCALIPKDVTPMIHGAPSLPSKSGDINDRITLQPTAQLAPYVQTRCRITDESAIARCLASDYSGAHGLVFLSRLAGLSAIRAVNDSTSSGTGRFLQIAMKHRSSRLILHRQFHGLMLRFASQSRNPSAETRCIGNWSTTRFGSRCRIIGRAGEKRNSQQS